MMVNENKLYTKLAPRFFPKRTIQMGYMGIQFSDTPIFEKQLIIRCVLYHFKMYVLICILYVYTYIYIYSFQVPFIVLILEFLHLGFFL